jgi:hypothetical protein
MINPQKCYRLLFPKFSAQFSGIPILRKCPLLPIWEPILIWHKICSLSILSGVNSFYVGNK